MTAVPLLPPAPGYTPRETFSPSALAAARRCRAYWGFRYIEGWKERELSWAEISAGADHLPRERGKALGKAVHAKLEAYYWPLVWHAPLVWLGEVDWTDEPGRRALAMLAHLPRLDEIIPGSCEIEAPITINVARVRSCAEPPTFNGFRDLAVRITDAAVKRLGLPPSDENRYTFDYKSTKDWKWQKPPEVLLDDEQGVLYPLHTLHAHDLETHVGVWVYSHTACATPTARTTVFVQTRDRAERLADELVVLAIDLRADMRSGIRANELPKDTTRCHDFGGCPYHPSSNGPCTPGHYSLGAAIAAQELAKAKEESIMGKFAEQIAAAAATAPATVAQPQPAAEPPPAAAEQPAAAAEPPPAATETPAATAARSKAKATKTDASAAGSVLELATKLAHAQAEAVKANERVAGVLAEIKAACG